VLDKLRYMRGSEPLPGYDALSPEEIATALSGADAETVKAVRSQGTPVQGSLLAEAGACRRGQRLRRACG
jgi:hypothetical protein